MSVKQRSRFLFELPLPEKKRKQALMGRIDTWALLSSRPIKHEGVFVGEAPFLVLEYRLAKRTHNVLEAFVSMACFRAVARCSVTDRSLACVFTCHCVQPIDRKTTLMHGVK